MLRILLLFNAVPSRDRQGAYSDCLSWNTIRRIYRALMESGNEIYALNVHSRQQLERRLGSLPRPHLAFTLAEGFLDQPASLYDGSGAAAVRQILEHYDIPSSHSSVAAMEICRHKHRTYQALQQAGLPVPPHRLLMPQQGFTPQEIEEIKETIGFPLFVKPDGGGNSIGISQNSIVCNEAELAIQVNTLRNALGELPVLVEKYLPGQEYTVGLIGCIPCYVLPALGFLSREVRTTAVKRLSRESEFIFPDDRRYTFLAGLAAQVLAAIGGKDTLRVDLRADSDGKLYIIDVNGTPSLGFHGSLNKMAAAVGLNYRQLINLVLYHSLGEYGLIPGGKLTDLIAPALVLLEPYNQDGSFARFSVP